MYYIMYLNGEREIVDIKKLVKELPLIWKQLLKN